MINISDEVRTAYLTDSVTKELTIESKGYRVDEYMNHSKFKPNPTASGSVWAYYSGNNDDFLRPNIGATINFKDSEGLIASDLIVPDVLDPVNLDKFDYFCFTFGCCIRRSSDAPDAFPSKMTFEIATTFGQQRVSQNIEINPADYEAYFYDDTPEDVQRIVFILPMSDIIRNGTFCDDMKVTLWNFSDTNFAGSVTGRYIAMYIGNDKSLLPYAYKEYNADDTDEHEYLPDININNDHLLSESFSLNESLCSEQNIKFGLCEAAYCQFTVTDDYHDFREREIRPSITVNLDSDIVNHNVLKNINLYAWETSPSGSEHKYWPYPGHQVSMSLRNMTLSNAQYWNNDACCQISPSAKKFLKNFKFIRISLDVEFHFDSGYTPEIMPPKILFGTSAEVEYPDGTIATNQWTMVSVNGVYTEFGGCNKIYNFSDFVNTYKTITVYVPIDYDDYFAQYAPTIWYKHGKLSDLGFNYNRSTVRYRFLKEDNTAYTAEDGKISMNGGIQNVRVSFVDSVDEPAPSYNKYDAIEFYGTSIDDYLAQQIAPIPLGVFTVNSIKKNHVNDILKQEITAYDRLTLLEQNAADWYTQYMFGVDTDGSTGRGGFEYARQIFSTYFNYTNGVGLENVSYYEDTEILRHECGYSTAVSSVKLTWTGDGDVGSGGYINYTELSVPNVTASKLYKVDIEDQVPVSFFIDNHEVPASYTKYVDKLARGLCSANILVKEDTGNKFCVDRNDYFMVSPNCTSLTIYIALKFTCGIETVLLTRTERLLGTDAVVYEANPVPSLVNGHTRLLYYNYLTKDIFACDSSITGRDVVRSLLEVNGCFYRLNRSTGKPEFIYCNKSGLYPADDLYPRNELYPRIGPNEIITRDKYQSFIQEDYTVQKFGKIQILKNITSSQTKSVVEWEYVGDSKYKNSYLIEDNIFYCNDKMEYDYEGMPEVASMLQNMFSYISNMDYVPCVLKSMGMPWIECGDRVTCLTKTGGAESFVFHRTLTGIQSLVDTFESEGDEYNREIKDYGYKEYQG